MTTRACGASKLIAVLCLLGLLRDAPVRQFESEECSMTRQDQISRCRSSLQRRDLFQSCVWTTALCAHLRRVLLDGDCCCTMLALRLMGNTRERGQAPHSALLL